MKKYELLIKAMHVAHSARENGLGNTADAFDNLVKQLSILIDAENLPRSAVKRKAVIKKLPRRLSTRKC